MKFTNLLFWVQENKLSEKFYKKLGFEVVCSTDEHSVVVRDGFQITLVNMRDEDPFTSDSMSGDKGRGMYIYFLVDDVDDEYNRQIELGFTPHTKPKDWEWGNREFVLKDLDGYKLVFFQKINHKQNH